MISLDALNRKILRTLQRDANQPIEALAKKLGASKTAIWNRIRKLRLDGIIKRDVVIVDPDKVGLGCCFYVLIRTSHHEKRWLETFLQALKHHPEILEAHRLAGDIDYILKVRVANPQDYDRFYQSLVSHVDIYNVTSLLSMEALIEKTDLPL